MARIWAVSMYIVVLTSFGIRTIDGGFNWLHALSALTFCTLTLGLWAVRKGNIASHQRFMTGSYFGLVGAFIGVVAVPGRRLPQMAVHDTAGLVLWVSALALTAGLTVAGLAQLRRKDVPMSIGWTDQQPKAPAGRNQHEPGQW